MDSLSLISPRDIASINALILAISLDEIKERLSIDTGNIPW
jgi:hypothetical protein